MLDVWYFFSTKKLRRDFYFVLKSKYGQFLTIWATKKYCATKTRFWPNFQKFSKMFKKSHFWKLNGFLRPSWWDAQYREIRIYNLPTENELRIGSIRPKSIIFQIWELQLKPLSQKSFFFDRRHFYLVAQLAVWHYFSDIRHIYVIPANYRIVQHSVYFMHEKLQKYFIFFYV